MHCSGHNPEAFQLACCQVVYTCVTRKSHVATKTCPVGHSTHLDCSQAARSLVSGENEKESVLSPTSSGSILNKLRCLQVGLNHSLDLQSRMSIFWLVNSQYLLLKSHGLASFALRVDAAGGQSKCAVQDPDSPCPQHPCHPLLQCALLPSLDFGTAARHQVIVQLNCNTFWHATNVKSTAKNSRQ